MVRGLLGVITSSLPSSLRKSKTSLEEPAASASSIPGPGSCRDRQLSTSPLLSGLFSVPGSSSLGSGEASGCTMGTLAATLPGDADPAAPPSRTELPASVSLEPARAAQLSPASPLVGLGVASLTFSAGSAVKSLCGGGTTRNSLGFLEMGGGFLLGDGPGDPWRGACPGPCPASASPALPWLRLWPPRSAAPSW